MYKRHRTVTRFSGKLGDRKAVAAYIEFEGETSEDHPIRQEIKDATTWICYGCWVDPEYVHEVLEQASA